VRLGGREWLQDEAGRQAGRLAFLPWEVERDGMVARCSCRRSLLDTACLHLRFGFRGGL
jgi:hypothetical protein